MKVYSTDSKIKYSYFNRSNERRQQFQIENPYLEILNLRSTSLPNDKKDHHNNKWFEFGLPKANTKYHLIVGSVLFILASFYCIYEEHEEGLYQLCYDLYSSHQCKTNSADSKCKQLSECIINLSIPSFISELDPWIIAVFKNIWVWLAPFAGLFAKIIYKNREILKRRLSRIR